MRHYPEMAKAIQAGPRANPTRAKARAKADESVIHAMVALARKLGFRTPQIKAILRQSPDQQIARAALLKAGSPSL
jgi:predicted RNase H-like nuclease